MSESDYEPEETTGYNRTFWCWYANSRRTARHELPPEIWQHLPPGGPSPLWREYRSREEAMDALRTALEAIARAEGK